jgi:hypothetical protein
MYQAARRNVIGIDNVPSSLSMMEVLYPTLDRCGIKRTPRADGFHAFRRATTKYLRKASGLELAAVQLGHKRMTNDR